jgi:hypothetical protein
MESAGIRLLYFGCLMKFGILARSVSLDRLRSENWVNTKVVVKLTLPLHTG